MSHTSRAMRAAWATLAGAPLLCGAALYAQANTATQPPVSADDPPARVARISALQGTVSFQPSGADEWSVATLNYTVTTGDRLFAGMGARAELDVGRLAMRIGENSDLTVTDLTDHFVHVGLTQGILRVAVYRLPQGDSVEVDTPNGALMLRAAGRYRVDIAPSDTTTIVTVDDGNLDAYGPGLMQTLRTGESARLIGRSPIELSMTSRPAQTPFDTWSADRDRRLTESKCGQYVSEDIPGCADLNEYGRWDVSDVYGPVWYPAHVPGGWIPYCYGHWGWIEPWGWTWVDDEPWGFAPFHYGRWVVIGTIWAWLPPPLILPYPYYAPALVGFVGGVGFGIGIQAWFPLGPGEPFYPWYHYSHGYLRDVNARNMRGGEDIEHIIGGRDPRTIHFMNRERGTVAVSSATFSNGRPVAANVMHVSTKQLGQTGLLPHPTVVPTAAAARGGPLAANPPARARPEMVGIAPEHPGQAAPRGATGVAGREQRPPLVTKNPPPVTKNPPRAVGPAGQHTALPRPLITRGKPALQNLPFSVRGPAMQAHPGRPLEPQQLQNLRNGRPAGPQRDPEFPPHPTTPPARPPARGRAG